MYDNTSTVKRSKRNHYPPKHDSVPERNIKNAPRKPKWWLWGIIFIGLLFFAGKILMSEKELPPGLVATPDGRYELSPERQAKLDQELEEMDDAMQYALVAKRYGKFPCYSCPNGQNFIYLNGGEIWKYGITRKGGATGRYPNLDLETLNLQFVEEFNGTLSECMKEERRKIYGYPFMPEANARDIILIRPPGNKNDS